jgi:hypothetical protein
MTFPSSRRHLPELGDLLPRCIPCVVSAAETHAFRVPNKDGPLYTS